MGRKRVVFELVDGVAHRTCKICQLFLPLEDNFYSAHSKGNLTYMAKCYKCYNPIRMARRNKEVEKNRAKAWRDRTFDQRRLAGQRYHQSEKGKKIIRAYRIRNREQMCANRRIYENKRRKENLNARLAAGLRASLRKQLKKQSSNKKASAIKLLGCSMEEFRFHIERQWLPGMTWENRGKWIYGQPMTWHVDHIRPCSSFDLIDPEQQKACFHYGNMQPMWAVDNITKGNKLNWKSNTEVVNG